MVGSGASQSEDEATRSAPADPTEPTEPAETTTDWNTRAALIVFVAYLVVAFFVLLFHFGDGRWFAGDEWGFLSNRSLSDVPGLFAPQNQHWSTVPIVAYQVLFKIFGLNTYQPYMAVTIALHLLLAGLLRIVMRRAGVTPWVATVTAGAFVLYGTGQDNILLGVQISMVGSLVFGLIQLLVANHDGRTDWRDAVALGAGALAIMSSSIGVPMVVAVGLAVLARRGWRAALIQTVPLAALYGLWWSSQRSAMGNVTAAVTEPGLLWDWVRLTFVGVFRGLGHYPVVGVAMAGVLVLGLVLAWVPLDRAALRRLASEPAALLIGSVALTLLIATQRGGFLVFKGEAAPQSSRYVSMATALLLPALAVAANAFIERWRWTAPALLVLVLVGVPANIDAFSQPGVLAHPAFQQGQRRFVEAIAASPLLKKVPREVYPDPWEFGTDQLTVGMVQDAKKAGRISVATDVAPPLRDKVDMRLRMTQSGPGEVIVDPHGCTTHSEPLIIEPDSGERFSLVAPLSIAREQDDATFTIPTPYDPSSSGTVLTTQFPDMTLRIAPVVGQTTFTWCDPV